MISIIIPSYNSNQNLINCIKSICSQKFNKYEIIVVDDGSIDNTVSEVKKSNCILIENKINKEKVNIISHKYNYKYATHY